jgi:hypothetical protein
MDAHRPKLRRMGGLRNRVLMVVMATLLLPKQSDFGNAFAIRIDRGQSVCIARRLINVRLTAVGDVGTVIRPPFGSAAKSQVGQKLFLNESHSNLHFVYHKRHGCAG